MKKRFRQRLSVIIIIALLILGVVLIILDWPNISKVLAEAEWTQAAFSLIFITLSYFFLSYGFTIVSNIFQVPMNQLSLMNVGFVSAAFNNLVDFMWMGGHALRLMLMQRKGVQSGQALAPSIFHSHFHNLGMFCLLPIGMMYLLVHRLVSPAGAVGLIIFTVVIIAFITVATVVVFKRSLRLIITNFLSKITRLVVKKDVTPFFNTFDDTMTSGVAAIKDHPRLLVLVIICVIAEWAFMLVGFWFCFGALGNPVSPGILITGFAVGISAGNLSMFPGGLGTQEASMAGVFSSLGVAFERGVLASILFRVVYDFIPFIVSLFFYRRLLSAPSMESAE
ncbi:MAG: flippase-like domain-containing protein [Dehalococcoidales bacterium]|nr:MAG: flippase-like domain-containing protein [Dehalococcoidales bacterium]